MRKDRLSKLVCFVSCLFICFCAVKIFMSRGGEKVVASSFSGGSGTEADPYIIKTKDDIQQLSDDTNGSVDYSGKYFRLDSDLDYEGSGITGSGATGGGNAVIKLSSNQFDGNGHVIKNFTSDRALFSLSKEAKLKNFGLINYNLSMTVSGGIPRFYILSRSIASGSSVDNCFIINSKSDVDSPSKIGAIFGQISSSDTKSSKIENCYVSNSVLKTTNHSSGNSYPVGTFVYCDEQNNGIGSRIMNCFCGVSVDIERTAKAFADVYTTSGSTAPTFNNCYHSITSINGSVSDNGLSTQKDLSALKVSDLSDAYRLSANAGHPVLKVFDPEITLSYTSGNQTYSMYENHSESDLSVTATLSRTLNIQGQNDKLAFYFDNETTPILTPSTSNEITIPAEKLNNLPAGTHKIKVMLLDDTDLNLPVKAGQNELEFTIESTIYPEIEKIDIVPTGHSRAQVNNLNSVSVTLTGKNFTPEYTANLIFKNESGSQVLSLELGNFDSNSTTKTFTVTGNKLNQIKNLDIAKYSVEVEVSR